jgi:spore maturation protein SpmA
MHIIFAFTYIGLVVLAFAGWVMNLYTVAVLAFATPGAEFSLEVVVRLTGIICFPLGAVAGWF